MIKEIAPFRDILFPEKGGSESFSPGEQNKEFNLPGASYLLTGSFP